MSIKRKLDLDDDGAEGRAESYGGTHTTPVPSKSVNRGQAVDAVSKTQMLIKFGQHVQARKSSAAKRAAKTELEPASSPLCSRCLAPAKQTTAILCSYCCCALCTGCQQQCCCCRQAFCSKCSTLDYAEHETRAVCLDCST